MIVRSRPGVLELFSIYRLSMLPRIAPQLLANILVSIVVIFIEHLWPIPFRGWTVAPFTLLGIALSIFLGFRNNACYDRWWEARRQLGALVSEMRSFARVLVTLPSADLGRRRTMVLAAIDYTYALMKHLRGTPMRAETDPLTAISPGRPLVHNIPDAILRDIATAYGAMLTEGEIGEQIYRVLDDHLSSITTLQAACERIRGTPTPFGYTLLVHRISYVFCFLLPFSLAGSLGYATPVFCAMVSYAFFGLDALGDQLEEPFGSSLNALPLQALAKTIEINLLEALGESNLPAPPLPVNSVLV